MPKKKKILVSCGTAIATSTVVAKKIEEKLGERGIPVEVSQCKAAEAPKRADGFDAVVTTTQISYKGDTPVLKTTSFLSGRGIDEDVDKIVEMIGG
ncbi:PTS sugar transporter subunit IIB [soil metagenome]|nr:PTS sugar transporter subunit IIB [Actinomycetota bacterium]